VGVDWDLDLELNVVARPPGLGGAHPAKPVLPGAAAAAAPEKEAKPQE
jgi:hypothetical protein